MASISSSTISSRVDIYNGELADSNTVISGGNLYVSSGGTADRTTVNALGMVEVFNGGLVSSTVLSGKASKFYSNGETFKEYYYAEMIVSSGGKAVNTMLESGGYLTVQEGGAAENTVVVDKGEVVVSKGGVINNTTLSTGAVQLEGIASNITVTDFRDRLLIISGGKITGTLTMGDDAGVSAEGGSIIDFDISGLTASAPARVNNLSLIGGIPDYTITVSATQAAGTYVLANGAQDFEGTISIGTESVNYGSVTVNGDPLQHGETSYALVRENATLSLQIESSSSLIISGDVDVNDGETISGATIVNGGTLYVRGGKVFDIVVDSGGRLNVSGNIGISSGFAFYTTVNEGGWMHVSAGGLAYHPTVNSGGSMIVSSGGSANSLIMTDNARVLITSSGKIGCEVTLSETGCFAMEAGAIFDFAVNKQLDPDTPLLNDWSLIQAYTSSGYSLDYNGGNIADYTATVSSAKGLYKLAGNADGFNTSITVKTPGNILGTLTIGNSFVYDDLSYSLIREDGILSLQITQATPASSNAVKTFRNDILVSSASVMTDKFLINGGEANIMHVSKSGIASNTTVNSGGSLYVSSSGTANVTTLNSGGYLCVSSGGTATGIAASKGTQLKIYAAQNTYVQGTSDGSAFEMKNAFISGYTISDFGHLYVTSGGSAINTTVNDGFMHVWSGGTATGIILTDSGVLDFAVAPDTYVQGTSGGSAFEMKNAFISGYIANSGQLRVSSGGTAINTTVNTNGELRIYSGGMASNTTFNGGRLDIYYGVHRGRLTLEDDADVYVGNGGIIDFTVSDHKADGTALINDLSLIYGDSDDFYTITVSSTQATGTYILAEGAEEFDQVITVYCDTVKIGSLSVGETIIDNSRKYSLAKVSGTLSFTVAPSMEFFTGHFSGKGTAYNNVAIYMPNKDGLVEVMYPNGGETFAVTDLGAAGEPWKMIGVGDFNGDGVSDVLWRNMSIGDVGSWLGDGSFGVTWQHMAGASVGEWEIVGVGDFNADATDDVLWYNTESGLMLDWQVQNGVYSSDAIIAGAAPGEWKFAGVGDFNGDGTDDILWHNQISGAGGYWALQNGTYESWNNLAGADPKEWTMIGIGDFDANGYDDVLWLNNDTGLVGCWANSNSGEVEWNTLAGAGDLGGWHYSGVGDFDSDGRADVLWAHDSGSIGAWITDKDRIAVNSWMVIA